MKQHLTIRGSLVHDEVRGWLERPVARLRKRLKRFPGDAVQLRIMVREANGRPRSEASLTLHLPSNTLACHEEGPDVHVALNEAFEELMRLLEKEKARLRRDQTWNHSADAFQQELFERMLRESSGEITRAHGETLMPHLGAVEGFVRHELRSLENNGEIARGEIDARDVVDAAVARVLARKGGRGVPSRRQLMQAASSALRAELERVRRSRAELRLEEDVPEVPPEEEVSTLGSEIFDFYQPDEDMSFEDLLGGIGATPEDLAATAESAVVLREALAAVPTPWRIAFRLRHSEGLDDLEIAQAIDVSKDEVPQILERTAVFLSARLGERGLLRERGAGEAP